MDNKPHSRRRRSGRRSSRGKAADNRHAGWLPRNATPIEVTISHIGGRGDGVGRCNFTHNYVGQIMTYLYRPAFPAKRC